MYLTTNHGVNFIIDDKDIDKCIGKKFYLSKGYVVYCENRKIKKLHRLLIGAQNGQETDHVNRDKLDNRKCNLRIVSHSENLQNRATWSKTGVKGLIWRANRKKYYLNEYIVSLGKHKHVATFSSIEEAKSYLRSKNA